MKIAFVSREDPFNRGAWSGTINSMFNCLKKIKNIKVYALGPLNDFYRIKEVLKRNYYNFFFNSKFDSNRTINLSKYYSNQIDQNIKGKKFNFIITNDSTLVAYIKSKIPIIIWTDATFKGYFNLYFKDKKINKETIRQGKIIEKEAFLKSRFVCFSSKWALKSAVNSYPNLKKKFRIIKYGSNFSFEPHKKNIFKSISIKKKNLNKLNFISVGVDWNRKGMSKALKLINYLNSKGIKSKLTIVGSKPKNSSLDLKNTKIIEFLDKNILEQEKQLSKLYLNSHFNLFFTKAEAYGISLVEASAHGVPSIVNKVGGVTSIIKENINGKSFNINTSIKVIGNYIINLIKKKNNYNNLCNGAYYSYCKSLSWMCSSKKINKLLKSSF